MGGESGNEQLHAGQIHRGGGAFEECLKVTLVYSNLTHQVVCLETGQDFVDILVGFLTLPMGCIVKLLLSEDPPPEKIEDHDLDSEDKNGPRSSSGGNQSINGSSDISKDRKAQQKWRLYREKCKTGGHNPLTSVANLYRSAAKMDEAYLQKSGKAGLLDLRPLTPFGGNVLSVQPVPKIENDEDTPMKYFCCGIACNFICSTSGTICPRHKRKMESPCKSVDQESENKVRKRGDSAAAGPATTGEGDSQLHRKKSKFIVTNTLEIYPGCSVKELTHLNMLTSEHESDFDHLEIPVSASEIIQLLRASFCPGSVLHRVFGKHCPRPFSFLAPKKMDIPPPVESHKHLGPGQKALSKARGASRATASRLRGGQNLESKVLESLRQVFNILP